MTLEPAKAGGSLWPDQTTGWSWLPHKVGKLRLEEAVWGHLCKEPHMATTRCLEQMEEERERSCSD